jgi:carboxypeptidase PM20D1
VRVLKALGVVAAAALIVLAIAVVARTVLVARLPLRIEPVRPQPIGKALVAADLSRAIQFKTVSYQEPGQFDRQAFLGLHDFLQQTFPQLHKTLSHESVADLSLLYIWKGSDPALKPVLLMAHQDVVPVAPGTENRWTEPPFEGRIADGYIWGRGALDDKASLVGIMEAVELLLKDGFSPHRTFYLAFGHDEEVEGTGAQAIAKLLASRGVELEYVLDEGGSILSGMIPGVSAPVALVGIAEKGYVSIELRVIGQGGHSSMPPRHTAIGVLSRALYRLEQHQMPAHISGLAGTMLASLAPAAHMPYRAIYSNLWLFGPLIETQLANSPASNAMLRTTTAETMVEGGVKDNVLPVAARAVVNFRILPGDSVPSVVEHVRRTINDPRVGVDVLAGAHDPSVVSAIDNADFRTLRRSILEVFPEVAVVSPYLVVGATDSRSYQALTRNTYRFIPGTLGPGDAERLHGTNERVSVGGFATAVAFYAQLIQNSNR